MSDSPENREIQPDFIHQLLPLPSRIEQAQMLREAGLLDDSGFGLILDYAEDLISTDPNQTRQLAILCSELASFTGFPEIPPRADYLRAQTHAIFGEFDAASEWIQAAREGYIALGRTGDALRTNVGLMQVFAESGRYHEALNIGQTILDAVGNSHVLTNNISLQTATLLAAKAHQNRGRCFEYMGRYLEAIDAYDQAEQRYRNLDMPEQIAHIHVNRGLAFLEQGRVREALPFFENAFRIFGDAGALLLQAQTLTNIADAHLALGNFQESLNAYEQARQVFRSLDIEAEQQLLLLDTANAYLALNLYPEALSTFTEAEAFLQNNRMTYHRARALWGMGAALAAQRRFAEAETALITASELFLEAENAPLRASVLLEQSALLSARGNSGLALQHANEALQLVNEQMWPVEYVFAQFRVAELLLPDVRAAEAHLLSVKSLVERLALPHLRFRLNQRLGHLRLLQGRDQEAQSLLEAAVEEIEHLRGSLANENMRTTFLRDKIAAYENLVRLFLGRDDDAGFQRAFSIAEQAKSRTLVDLLTGLIDVRLEKTVESDIMARLRTLQTDLNAIYNEMLNPQGSERHVELSDLSDQALVLENEINLLRLQTSRNLPVTDTLARSLSLEAIQAGLPPDITMLVYHTIEDEIIAFVIRGGRLFVQRQLTTTQRVTPLLHKLMIQWNRFGIGKAFIHRHTKQLEQSAQHYLGLLYHELIQPVEKFIEDVGETVPKWVVVPHGILHQIPFHALYDGQQYLLEKAEISYAPSATIFAMCQQRSYRATGRTLVMGVADASIPFVEEEVNGVSQFFSNVQVFLNQDATPAVLEAQAANCDILHFACHGLFRSGNPMFSALKLHDAWLTATDVMALDLTGTAVTLSACETGRSQVLAGDEIIGLSRAFLGAGAATVTVSLWLVEDESTSKLMAVFYEQMKKQTSMAAALRAAQLFLKSEYSHPYYWAPFILMGHV